MRSCGSTSANIGLPSLVDGRVVERVHQQLFADLADRACAPGGASSTFSANSSTVVDRLAAALEVAQPRVVHRRALGQVLLDAEDVAGEELLDGHRDGGEARVVGGEHVVAARIESRRVSDARFDGGVTPTSWAPSRIFDVTSLSPASEPSHA